MRTLTSLVAAVSLALAVGCAKKEESAQAPTPAPKEEPKPVIKPNPDLNPDTNPEPVIGPNGVPMPRLSKTQPTTIVVMPVPDKKRPPIVINTPVESKPKPVVVDPKGPESGLQVAPPPREKK